MRYIYSALFYLFLPLILLRLLWRSRRNPAYRERVAERLGFYSNSIENCIWLHAVSVGETIAAIPLVKALQQRFPNAPILITNMTPTGAARVKAAFGDTVKQAYVPYDLPDVISRFVTRVKPRILIVMETELWPNLFAGCKKNHVPIVVTNARLSEKSMRGYQRIASLTHEMLNTVSALSSQGFADAERFAELGLAKDKITVTGNLKFDIQLPDNLPVKTEELFQQVGRDRKIWIAASTHPGEEEIVLAAHRKILEHYPHALLILVPRHPERFDAIAQLIEQSQFKLARRSQKQICDSATQVYLADTMGELLVMYSVADAAFIAGSFAQVGGHNMLEAAVQGKPIVTGPQLYNFAEISQMLIAAKGMFVVQNANELADCIMKFFTEEGHAVGKNALEVVMQNRGSLQKQVDVIAKMLSQHF